MRVVVRVSAIVCLAVGCTDSSDPSGPTGSETGSGADFPAFADVTTESGIAFQRDNGFDGTHWRVSETINGGLALLDFDADGRLDVYVTNGRKLEPGPSPATNRLYRNVGGWRFEDVSVTAGVAARGMSFGCAVADIDGDDFPDIHVTNDGPNRLYRNMGDGTFEDIAPVVGVAGVSMDTGAVFLDMDADGDLDLYVASYVVDEQTDSARRWPPVVVQGVPGYWPPTSYPAAPDTLYENRDGSYVDVSASSGIRSVEAGRGLGVIASDFNADGHVDIFVANDLSANFMFLGDGTGHFEDHGFVNGTAYGENGDALGSMGLDLADYDADGFTDLLVTNYYDQPNNLYRATVADAVDYAEMAHVAGLATSNLPEVSWGVNFVDLDHDGWKDLFVANGHLNPRVKEMIDSTSYEQRNRIYRNVGGSRFTDVAGPVGGRGPLALAQVSRGSAHGDLDNDGDLDLVVLNSIGPPQLLRNDCASSNAWALVRVVGQRRNREAIGARVTLTAAGRSQWQERTSAASYLSVNDSRLHFGLGAAASIDRLEVRWPDGETEIHTGLAVRKLLTVKRGGGVDVADLR